MMDDLDNLIDDVAKAMTAVPPDTRLAARVSMRIAGAGDRRARWSRPWVLLPIASACALVLAVFVAREGAKPVKPVVMPSVAKVEEPAPYVERAFQARGRVTRTALRMPELSPVTFDPIEIDRLDVQPLVEMDEIQIGPIAIDRIDIAAMP